MNTCRGVYLGLAMFALVAHLFLGLGGSVLPFWLPACVVVGVLAALMQRCPGAGSQPNGRTWVLACTIAAVLAVCIAFVLEMLRIPPHDWDAVAAWSVKARYLHANPSLAQPFFQDPGVWHHSRDYPLLQPLCVASSQALALDRMLFVFLYLLMVCTTGFAVRQAGAGRDAACAAAAALGLTPILVDPTSGGFTSGYADAFLATAVTGAAAGLLLRDGWLLAAGTILVVMVKPEGLAYAGVILAVPWLLDQRRLLLFGLAGFVLAAGLWLPIQLQLQHAQVTSPGWIVWPSLLGLSGILALSQHVVKPRRRPAWVLALIVVSSGIVCLVLLKFLFTGLGQQQGSLTAYFQDLGRMVDRLGRLPHILWGLAVYLFLPRKVGLLFAFLIAWLILRKRLGPWPSPANALGLLLVLAVPCLVMPYLLSTEENLAHQMRSSMGRLLIHWLGAGWLLGGLGVGQVLAQANPQEQAHDQGSGEP